MSKYEELSELGMTYSVEFNQKQEKCSVFAHELIQKLANYLECPPETMFYRKITKDLCSGERKWAVAQ